MHSKSFLNWDTTHENKISQEISLKKKRMRSAAVHKITKHCRSIFPNLTRRDVLALTCHLVDVACVYPPDVCKIRRRGCEQGNSCCHCFCIHTFWLRHRMSAFRVWICKADHLYHHIWKESSEQSNSFTTCNSCETYTVYLYPHCCI